MTVYVVTASNYNEPAFWAGIAEAEAGHTLDFSPLPPGFEFSVNAATNSISIWNGVSWYRIGSRGNTSVDAVLGGTMRTDQFTTLIGRDRGGARHRMVLGQEAAPQPLPPGAATTLEVSNVAETPVDLYVMGGSGGPLHIADIPGGATYIATTAAGTRWMLQDGARAERVWINVDGPTRITTRITTQSASKPVAIGELPVTSAAATG